MGFGKSETVGREKKDTISPLDHEFFYFPLIFVYICTIILTVQLYVIRGRPELFVVKGLDKIFFWILSLFSSSSTMLNFSKIIDQFLGPIPRSPESPIKTVMNSDQLLNNFDCGTPFRQTPYSLSGEQSPTAHCDDADN